MEKSTINLHMHTNCSLDGSESPALLLDECEQKGIKVPNANTYNANTEYAHAALYRLLSETEQGTSFSATI